MVHPVVMAVGVVVALAVGMVVGVMAKKPPVHSTVSGASLPPGLIFNWMPRVIFELESWILRQVLPLETAAVKMLGYQQLLGVLHACHQLRVWDAIASLEREGKTPQPTTIAAKVGVKDERAMRVMLDLLVVQRFLAPGYKLTRMTSEMCVGGKLEGMFTVVGGPFFATLSQLAPALKQGKKPFFYTHGTTFFEFCRKQPQFARAFDEFMATTQKGPSLAAAVDFPHWGQYETLVDVGGGTGTLAFEIAGRYPEKPSHLIVCDQAHCEPGKTADQRVSFKPLDFFQASADDFPDGDCYVLKNILHNWDDKGCVAILRKIRHKLTSNGSYSAQKKALVIVDLVLPPTTKTTDSMLPQKYLYNVAMYSSFLGIERTLADWRDLLGQVGFHITDIHNTRSLNSVFRCSLSSPHDLFDDDPSSEVRGPVRG